MVFASIIASCNWFFRFFRLNFVDKAAESAPTIPNIVIPSGGSTVEDKLAITVPLIIVMIIVVPKIPSRSYIFSSARVCSFHNP